MSLPPLSLRLTGAQVLRDRKLVERTVAISGGRISAGPFPAVDLRGFYVLPGVVDLHADHLSRHLAHGTTGDALVGAETEAACAGITTLWLNQHWSPESGARSADAAEALVAQMNRDRSGITDLRLKLTYQRLMLEDPDRIIACARRSGVGMVIFADDLSQMLALADTNMDAFVRLAQARGQQAALLLDRLRSIYERRREAPRRLCRLAEAFDTLGVIYGSAGDPDGESRETHSMLGAKLCQSPAGYAAASVAQAVGDPVTMPASAVFPNWTGAVSARTLLGAGKCQALVSDGHPAALTQAVFHLVDQGVCDLPRAWRLISETPAEIMRLPDRGLIEPGRRADLAIVNARTLRVEATICEGRITHLTGEAASRFIAPPQAADFRSSRPVTRRNDDISIKAARQALA